MDQDNFRRQNTLQRPGVGQYAAPPPDPFVMYRDFSRYDYSHHSNPSIVPHVREYEHGLWAHGIPVFDHRVPPSPIVSNSVSQNPSLAQHYAPRDPGLNVASFQSLRGDLFNVHLPTTAQGSLPPDPSIAGLLARFQALESKVVFLEGENSRLRGLGVKGGGITEDARVEDGPLDDGLVDPTGEGTYKIFFYFFYWPCLADICVYI